MRKALFLLFLLATSVVLKAQFPYGTTGLLRMPTADMQRDKTFMAGASFLHTGTIPPIWSYNTYNYYINITLFPWIEVGYSCTLNKGLKGVSYWPERTWGKFVNQDRQFSVRLRLIKEEQFNKYVPALVIGINDITTRDLPTGSDGIFNTPLEYGNGVWNRYYLALTKHFNWSGIVGVHLAYIYNRRWDYPLNGIAVGVEYSPRIHPSVKLMAEYDSRTVNLGLGYSIWKDHINLIGELNDFRYLSAGIYFKIHLK